jgi:hypothetical protein
MTDGPLTGNASARAERDSPLEEGGFEPLVPRKKDGVFRDDLIDRRPLLLPENQATPSRGGPGVRILPPPPASPFSAGAWRREQRRKSAAGTIFINSNRAAGTLLMSYEEG